ncbi:MAG: GNAT family N-acetyltransferase [Flavobacteriales bacterium]|nr:GNAT family N-acetyltransferase [Flavobacteriales bacterium]
MINVQCTEIAFQSPLYRDSVQLRDAVLRAPLGLRFSQSDLDEEVNQLHLAAFHQDQLIAILILVSGEGFIKMRQVAVHPDFRGKGVGEQLVRYSEQVARNLGFKLMTLHARLVARDFYLKLKYETDGILFEEVGIPHVRMWKKLG